MDPHNSTPDEHVEFRHLHFLSAVAAPAAAAELGTDAAFQRAAEKLTFAAEPEVYRSLAVEPCSAQAVFGLGPCSKEPPREQLIAPALPTSPFVLLPTHFRAGAALPLLEVVDRIRSCLQRLECCFEFISEKCKFKVRAFIDCESAEMRLRVYEDKAQSSFVIEARRCMGERMAFCTVYRAIKEAFSPSPASDDGSARGGTAAPGALPRPPLISSLGSSRTRSAPTSQPECKASDSDSGRASPAPASASAAFVESVGSLLSMAQSGYVDVQREGSRALVSLAANSDVRPLLAASGVVPVLAQLAQSRDWQVQLYAVSALCELSESAACQQVLVESGALSPLLDVTRATPLQLHCIRERVRAITNLCDKYAMHVMEAGGAAALSLLIRTCDDPEVQHAGATALRCLRGEERVCQATVH